MSGWRSNGGWAIDRSQGLTFTFDGKTVPAFKGDTVASALLASGQRIVGRSFKYHRPRGFWGVGSEEPNGIADVQGAQNRPNAQMTLEPAVEGLRLRSINAHPTAEHDRMAFLDRFARFIPAAFYYKTFMLPDWHLFEPQIRAMAGLGRLDRAAQGFGPTAPINASCDVLVIGAGPAGLSEARTAAKAGRSVILCDEGERPGGTLLYRPARIDGQEGRDWVDLTLAELAVLGVRILTRTTAFGRYDHGLTGLAEAQPGGAAPRLWRVRAAETILAAGAMERHLPFANNDLPGVMSAEAGLQYLSRFGVVVGRRVVIATTNGTAYDTARALHEAGADVKLLDLRGRAAADQHPFRIIAGQPIEAALGRRQVEAVRLVSGERIEADTVLVSGGHTPTVHLYSQSQGKLRWDDCLQAFLPGDPVQGLRVVGAAVGIYDLSRILPGQGLVATAYGTPTALWPKPRAKGRIWLDMQNDVTAKDVELAHRENLTSVEHLKRYTTLGMANDQGRMSNLPGLALMAELTGRTIPETGTTTYRPPFSPVPLASFAGLRGGELMNPVRRLPLESEHRADGALFREYGGWLRPAWYGADESAVLREAKAARAGVGLFDGSPLGKIEVIGPDAAKFLDFIYYNTMSTLKPGRCRYGFVLTEGGAVYDDGVLVRLDENRFIVSCSSSHVQGMGFLLEEWRQDSFDRSRVVIHDTTANYATLTVTGPKSRDLLLAVDLGAALDDAALPHMALTFGSFEGTEVRITRVSFTGDRSYELSIRADRAVPLWRKLKAEGKAFGATLLGGEALMILRAEKGYIVVGKDTDGRTRPMDLGVKGPFEKRKGEYLGRRSLHLPAVADQARDLVGFESLSATALPVGAHVVETVAGKRASRGFVTTSHDSPTLGRPIALGLVEGGAGRMGEVVTLYHLGQTVQARIAPVCALDPDGRLLDA